MFPRLAVPLIAISFASPVIAQDADTLFDVLRLDEVIQVMADEGQAYARNVGADLFPNNPSDPEWQSILDVLYDPDTMARRVRADFSTALDGADIGALVAFYTDGVGHKAIGLEISARNALLDPSVEATATEIAALASADNTDRYRQIVEFIDENDLIESNVVAGLNSNFAFYLGLWDGGALGTDSSQDQLLADVWKQEPDIRSGTTEWLFTFLMLAYQPLSDEELDAYIAFSKTDPGQDVNQALFGGFDGLFEDINRGLGLGAAKLLISSEL